MIKRGKRTISGKTRIREWRDCEWRMCTNSWNRERPFGGRSEDKRSIYAMEMASKWECFHFDANARVRRFESEKRYNDRYERLLILWWYARCAETKKSREIKILTIPDYPVLYDPDNWDRQKVWEDALRHKYEKKITVQK